MYFLAIKSWEIYLERGVDNLCKWWNQRPRRGDAEPKLGMRSRTQGCGAETRDAEPKPGMRSRHQGCGAETRDAKLNHFLIWLMVVPREALQRELKLGEANSDYEEIYSEIIKMT